MRERREKFRGKLIKIYFFLQYCYSIQNCIVTALQKNLQYLGLAFPDAEHFGTQNVKFSLHLVLAFPNADTLTLLLAYVKFFVLRNYFCTVVAHIKPRTRLGSSCAVFNPYPKTKGCSVEHFNNFFSVFKQYYTLFHTLFHPYIFQKIQTILLKFFY